MKNKINKYKKQIMTVADIILQTALLFGTSLVTFIFTKRKYNAESKSVELGNIESSLKVYVNIITDLETRVEKLQDKIGQLEIFIDKLKDENKGLKEKLTRVCKYPENPKCD